MQRAIAAERKGLRFRAVPKKIRPFNFYKKYLRNFGRSFVTSYQILAILCTFHTGNYKATREALLEISSS